MSGVENSGGQSVVILDDCEDLLELAELFIDRFCNYATVACKSLAEMQARQDQVMCCRLAILDINLGAGQPDGIDAYLWLRASGFPGRIVFLTGHADSNPLVVKAGRLKGTKIYSKPLPPSELIELVRDGVSSAGCL